MLEDLLNRKNIDKELLLKINDMLSKMLNSFSIYFNDSDNSCILLYNFESIRFNNYKELYEYISPFLIKLNESINNELKKERILRDMLVNACDEITTSYAKCKFTVSFYLNESNTQS